MILSFLTFFNLYFILVMIHTHYQALKAKKETIAKQSQIVANFVGKFILTRRPTDKELIEIKEKLKGIGCQFDVTHLIVQDSLNRIIATTDHSLDFEILSGQNAAGSLVQLNDKTVVFTLPLKDKDKKMLGVGFDVRVLKGIDRRQFLLGLLMFLGINLITIIVVQIFIPYLTRPVAELIGLTRRIKDGDFDLKIKPRKDEFGELQQNFYKMGIELKRAFGDLKKRKESYELLDRLLMEDITAWKVKDFMNRIADYYSSIFSDSVLVIGIEERRRKSLDIRVYPPDCGIPRNFILNLLTETMDKKTMIQHRLIDRKDLGGYHTALFFPFSDKEKIYGAIGMLSRGSLDLDDSASFELFSKAANHILNYILLLRRLKDYSEFLKDIHLSGLKISLSADLKDQINEAMDQAARLFNFKRISTFIIKKGQWLRFDWSHPLTRSEDELRRLTHSIRNVRIVDQKLMVGPLGVKDKQVGYIFGEWEENESIVDKSSMSLIAIFLNQLSISLINSSLYSELNNKCEILEGLHEISKSFSFAKEREIIFGEMVEKIARFTGVTKILISLYDPEKNELSGQLPGYGVSEEAVKEFKFKLDEPSVARQIFETDRPFYTNNILSDSTPIKRFVKLFDLKTLLAVPLKVKGKMIGILYAADKVDCQPFTEDDLQIYTIFASQASSVIEHIKLYDEMKRHIHELAILNEMQQQFSSSIELSDVLKTIIQVIQEKTGYDFLGIGLYDEYSKEIVGKAWSDQAMISQGGLRTQLGKGIVGNAALVGEPIYIPDTTKDENYIEILPGVKSELAIPIKYRGRLLGVLDIESKQRNAFSPGNIDFLKTVANLAGLAIENALLYYESERGFVETVKALVMMIDANDHYTRGHSERVMNYSVKIAERMGLSQEEINEIRYAALLHDIGKVGVSEVIIAKKGELTDEERDEVKLHPLIGAQMLDEIKYFSKIRFLIRSHHEHYDGSGYPYGIKGDAIPLGARIIAVADNYEALTSDRPYRPAFSRAQAIEILKEGAGTKFDPEIVGVLLTILRDEEIEEI